MFTYDEDTVTESLFELLGNETNVVDITPQSMVEDDQMHAFVNRVGSHLLNVCSVDGMEKVEGMSESGVETANGERKEREKKRETRREEKRRRRYRFFRLDLIQLQDQMHGINYLGF